MSFVEGHIEQVDQYKARGKSYVMTVKQDTLTAILLFAASVISIPITAGMSGVYCISIPVGLMMAAFACCEDGTDEDEKDKKDKKEEQL